MAEAMTADPTPATLATVGDLLAKPTAVEGVELDTTYFIGTRGPDETPGARTLLPGGYRWQSPGPESVQRIPLPLCEFLAYKTALAYEPADRIEAFLARCCAGVSHVRVFDSTRDRTNSARVLADAQAFGFVFQRTAFLIFRGTSSGNDWKINRIDTLTSDLREQGDRRIAALRRSYGHLLDRLGDPVPGRHVGFSIAWAALKDEVEDWLGEGLERDAFDTIIYSGHSLGGAMAQVAAFDHARIESGFERDRGIAPSRVGAVVTFGAPAVGGAEFTAAYRSLLGDRTVLLESSGDLVPRIMNRWYYRMLYPLRQRVKAGVQAHLVTHEGFGKVAKPWTFASEPPLSDSDIDAAISAIRDAAAKVARDLEAERQRQEKARAETTHSIAKDGRTGSTPDAQAAKAEPAPTWVYWVVAGVVVLVVAGIAWYFVRRKLFSHDIEQRYALYLSTLSYQQLRAKHGGNLELAHTELAEHLRFVRGDLLSSKDIAAAIPAADGTSTAFFESVQALPLLIRVRNDPAFLEYLRKSDTFV
jgi:pimeloyl-ACP methyl ester carboxylesterase